MLDGAALESAMDADPNATLALLADLVTATDEGLRAAARALAARLVLDRARLGSPRQRGVGRLRTVPADRGGDIDVDASLDLLVQSRAERRPAALDELVSRDWARPALAICLVVDRSGSMSGSRLAAAAMTAAACAWRAAGDHAVLAFAREVSVIRPMDGHVPAEAVVNAVLALRGHGTTAVGEALRRAHDQLARSRASRRVVVLLSDCRSTDAGDAGEAARRLPELVVLAPADDCDEAADLARRSGARWAPLHGPADAPGLLSELLG